MGDLFDFEGRKTLIRAVEKHRGGRTLLCFFNFDRQADPPIPGLSTLFHADVKEALFRVLKESSPKAGVDLCLYTRGGDTNAVWPIVSLVREFDPDFEVIVPFRCHSSGTLAALGAKRIVLVPLSELSPIDPTTGNQFNPRDQTDPHARLGISVEDVRAYGEFVLDQFGLRTQGGKTSEGVAEHLGPFLQRLATEVHPLALGNVYRVLQQIKQLARSLLELHVVKKENKDQIVSALTTQFYSHLHMINCHEAQKILGSRVQSASDQLAADLDRLLRAYEDKFDLRRTFYLASFLGDKQEIDVRFIGGLVESAAWSYLFETRATIRQVARPPQNVQIQIPFGQPMPLIPGLPRETQVEIKAQGWVHNIEPLGVTT